MTERRLDGYPQVTDTGATRKGKQGKLIGDIEQSRRRAEQAERLRRQQEAGESGAQKNFWEILQGK